MEVTTALDCTSFIRRMRGLHPGELLDIAGRLSQQQGSADGEVAWWRATMAVSSALRGSRRTREASLAAHRTAVAVLAGAAAANLLPDHQDQATAVARSAAEVSRLLVAGGPPAVGPDRSVPLLAAFVGCGIEPVGEFCRAS